MCKINKPVINMERTAAKLKEFRLSSGYSVREIQSVFNFSSPEAIYGWEKGKYLPSIDNLLVIASVYDVRVDDIIAHDEIEIECELPSNDNHLEAAFENFIK